MSVVVTGGQIFPSEEILSMLKLLQRHFCNNSAKLHIPSDVDLYFYSTDKDIATHLLRHLNWKTLIMQENH